MLNCQNALLAHIYFVQFVMKNWFQCCSCLFTRNGSVIHLECGLELDWPIQEKWQFYKGFTEELPSDGLYGFLSF